MGKIATYKGIDIYFSKDYTFLFEINNDKHETKSFERAKFTIDNKKQFPQFADIEFGFLDQNNNIRFGKIQRIQDKNKIVFEHEGNIYSGHLDYPPQNITNIFAVEYHSGAIITEANNIMCLDNYTKNEYIKDMHTLVNLFNNMYLANTNLKNLLK
jgi:hypothetical protein